MAGANPASRYINCRNKEEETQLPSCSQLHRPGIRFQIIFKDSGGRFADLVMPHHNTARSLSMFMVNMAGTTCVPPTFTSPSHVLWLGVYSPQPLKYVQVSLHLV